MSEREGKTSPPSKPDPPETTPKKPSFPDNTKSKQPTSQKPAIRLSAHELPSKKKQLTTILSKNNFGKYLHFDFLKNLFGKVKGGGASDMGDSAAKVVGRPMKYPYTFAAKIAQFPFKFYVNNCWLFRYYLIAVAVSTPVFYKIGKLSYSPENVRVWEEKRRKMFTPGGHH